MCSRGQGLQSEPRRHSKCVLLAESNNTLFSLDKALLPSEGVRFERGGMIFENIKQRTAMALRKVVHRTRPQQHRGVETRTNETKQNIDRRKLVCALESAHTEPVSRSSTL